jgi:O-antigen ligase
MYTLFVIGMFLMDKHKWRRVAYGILIAGGIYSMLYSYSRGAYVGFGAGLVFIALVKSRKLLIPLFLLLFLWKVVLPSSVVDRIDGTFVEEGDRAGVITIGDTNLSTAYRSEIWQEAWSIFTENPVVGTGFRTFGKLTGWDTHNQYLKTLSEQGIIGLLIYLLLYQRALKSGWQLYKEGDEELLRAFGFAFVCAVLGSMVVNVFGDRWTYLQLGGIYWVLWALADQENSRIALQRQAEGARLEAEAMGLRITG